VEDFHTNTWSDVFQGVEREMNYAFSRVTVPLFWQNETSQNKQISLPAGTEIAGF
jgi:hypothetical protein